MNAARMLKAAVERSGQGHRPEQITDEFAQAVARRLESRGITEVPGLPDDTEQPQWYDIAIEKHRRQQEIAAQRVEQERAEEEARNAPQTAAGLLSAAIKPRTPGAPIPLNGAAVLRAALSGVGDVGTVNGS